MLFLCLSCSYPPRKSARCFFVVIFFLSSSKHTVSRGRCNVNSYIKFFQIFFRMNHHFNAVTRKTGRHSAASERDSSMRLLSQNATYFFVFCRKFASNAVRCENVLKTIQTFLLQSFTAVISDARLTGHWSASRTVPFSLSVQDFARFPFLFLHFRR